MTEINQERLVTNFLKLVQIDAMTTQERLMADEVMRQLNALGFEVFEDHAGEKIGGNSGNVIAKLPATRAGAPIMFSAHMDRVTPGLGIRPVVKEGVIHSDGSTILAADDLAGVASIIEAVQTIVDYKLPHPQIEIAFTVAEEGGLRGAKNLDYTKLTAKMGFVLDSSGPVGNIVVRGPAQDRIEATIKGKAAHAGVSPEEGNNAIIAAAVGLARMNVGRIDAETTANIGVIQGGTATNIVPESVSIKGEARSLDGAKLRTQSEHMKKCLEEGARERGATAEVKISRMYSELNLKASDPVVEIAIRAVESLGLSASLVSSGGGSDANIFNQQGIATVNLGLGYHKVHTTEENIAIADLVKVAKLALAIVHYTP